MPTKILAIDDSKTMRLAIKITFAAEDCEVIAVSKGSEAVARAKKMGADVLLVDANLAAGEPSGYDVCKAMKADSATSHIPVLILVSNQTGPDQSKLSASGA
ncbi:MAG: response regulator, partial [Nannocystaceae bacterium]